MTRARAVSLSLAAARTDICTQAGATPVLARGVMRTRRTRSDIKGSADINLYKLFLEAAHAVLRPSGRLGFIVPSGLYSDSGTRALRDLFLNHCHWEWLFGIENRDKMFPIDSRFKFNSVIVEKSGTYRGDPHRLHAP